MWQNLYDLVDFNKNDKNPTFHSIYKYIPNKHPKYLK